MKITLDIPDDALAGIFTVLHGNWCDLNLHNHGISQSELRDGAIIAIVPKPQK